MAFTKSEKTAVLTLLDMASSDTGQADKRAGRATVLEALGMSEQDAAEHLAAARDAAEQAEPAEAEAEATSDE